MIFLFYSVCLVQHVAKARTYTSHSEVCIRTILAIYIYIYTRRYVARVDKSHPLIALSSQFSVTDPLISRMVDSLAADITF